MSLLLGKCHHVEVVEEGAESDDDEESCQVENSLLNRASPLVDAESVVDLILLLPLLDLEVAYRDGGTLVIIFITKS